VTARILGSVVFFASIAPLSWELGVIGAAIAFVLGNVATTVVMVFQLLREYRRVRRPKTA
jgi:Na+-driven multidrug efflux pump